MISSTMKKATLFLLAFACLEHQVEGGKCFKNSHEDSDQINEKHFKAILSEYQSYFMGEFGDKERHSKKIALPGDCTKVRISMIDGPPKKVDHYEFAFNEIAEHCSSNGSLNGGQGRIEGVLYAFAGTNDC